MESKELLKVTLIKQRLICIQFAIASLVHRLMIFVYGMCMQKYLTQVWKGLKIGVIYLESLDQFVRYYQ